MKTVNALTIRNRLGSVLEELDKTGQPIMVSKGREVRAVLISVADFQRRFVDKQAEDKKIQLLEKVRGLSAERSETESSIQVLRAVRGYQS